MSLKFDIMTLHFLPEDATHTTQDRDPVLVSPARPLLGTISPEKAVSRYQQIGKRTLECLIILLCMPLILPILLAAALAVSIAGGVCCFNYVKPITDGIYEKITSEGETK